MAHNSELKNWLAENPKMMGVLWAIMLFLAETGMAVANDAGASSGP